MPTMNLSVRIFEHVDSSDNTLLQRQAAPTTRARGSPATSRQGGAKRRAFYGTGQRKPMTIELSLAIALVILAVLTAVMGFNGKRSRAAILSRTVFYSILFITMVSLVIGLLGVGQVI